VGPGIDLRHRQGGIGWGVPAAVGIALFDRARGVNRPVVATIGDGSFQYSVQAIWTAAQHRLPVVFVVMRNREYSILKSFAALEKTPGVPGLDLPGLDIASIATGFGCRARNPYDRTRIPGASSGGTGVAVAARMAPAGIGSDTAGSVRVPAALCGVQGLRPTLLRWPQQGIVPISHTRDMAGPMARGVTDLALLDGVVTGSALTEAPATLKGVRIGVPRGLFWDNLHPDTAKIAEDTLKALANAGVVLVEADIPDVGALDQAAGVPIALYEAIVDLDKYLADHKTGLDVKKVVAEVASPDVKGILSSLLGEMAVPEAAYREALTVHRPKLQRAYADYFKRECVEAVIFPTTPLPAANLGEDETTMLNGAAVPTFATFIRNTGPGSVAGIPGLSLAAGLTPAGLPVGMELDAPEGGDRRLLALGCAIEALLPKLPPPRLD
jgi:indoleacetamide hydrolase